MLAHAAWSAYNTSSRQDHSSLDGIAEANEQVTFPPLSVTVAQLPVTRCEISHRTVAFRPGSLGEVLTEHYRRAIPKRSAPLPVVSAGCPHGPAGTVADVDAADNLAQAGQESANGHGMRIPGASSSPQLLVNS